MKTTSTQTTTTIHPSAIKGFKEKRYGKQTYCLGCAEATRGSKNRDAYQSGKISGVVYLTEGTCDQCHTTF